MLAVEAFVFIVILVNIWLGFSVFLKNPKRSTNKFYLFHTIVTYLWLFATLQIMSATSAENAELFIQLATLFSAFIPFSLHLIALSVEHPALKVLSILLKMKGHIVIAIAVIAAVLSPYLVKEVIMPGQDGNISPFPDARYGIVFPFFILYMLGMTISLVVVFHFARKKLSGIQRVEIEFLMFAATTALIGGIFTSPILSLLIDSSYYIPISNAFSIMIFNAILAYGIATRHIFDISVIFRKVGVCSTSTLVVLTLSVLAWAIVSALFPQQYLERTIWFPIILGLAISMVLCPLYSKMLLKLNSLFGRELTMSEDILSKSHDIVQSITTTQDLISKSSAFLAKHIEAESVDILLDEDNSQIWVKTFSDGENMILSENSPSVKWVKNNKRPLARYTLTRQSANTERLALMRELEELDAHAVAGVFFKSRLKGIILLGEPSRGGIYDKMKTDALWLFANQLGTSLENTRLYSDIANQRVYMGSLLENMVNGVLAIDSNSNISVCNSEAERMLEVDANEVVGKKYSILKPEISFAFESILDSGEDLRNYKTLIRQSDGSEIPILLGGSTIMREDGVRLGTMLVFNDETALKTLEAQVRRSERLASVGQLAAGMAHEIKNPLVSIKTFAELLPERYEDGAFRSKFSMLVNNEVNRIDNIVNQLMDFSRPAKPHYSNISLHSVIDKVLELLEQEISNKGISLKYEPSAEEDIIRGDQNLIHQAFVNIILNAISSIGNNGGEISISTRPAAIAMDSSESRNSSRTANFILAEFKDSGCGIEEEDLKHIFDPFFTKTEGGAGMGLSVTHTILMEHDAVIDVKSRLGEGTVFTAAFQLIEEDGHDPN